MAKINIKVGQRFKRLVTVRLFREPNHKGHNIIMWECICDCGNIKNVKQTHLAHDFMQSCGCLHRDNTAERNRANATHGARRRSRPTPPEYPCWSSMLSRCLNKTNVAYDNYGARGIKVCERWQESFENFIEDMGPKPSAEYSLDRIDVNGNYEPENCRWATWNEQGRNKRNSIYITIKGETKHISEWVEITGISKHAFTYRLKMGWPEERMLEPTHNTNTRVAVTEYYI